MAGHFYNCHLGRCQRLLKYIPNTLKWITYLFQILTIWAMSLHFSFDIGCTFCSLKASTKMHLFWIGTNTAAFRTLRLSSQGLDKARVHRHPALDSRLTWPKWSQPNMRSPPPFGLARNQPVRRSRSQYTNYSFTHFSYLCHGPKYNLPADIILLNSFRGIYTQLVQHI